MKKYLALIICSIYCLSAYPQEKPILSIGLIGGFNKSKVVAKNDIPGNYDFITGYDICAFLTVDLPVRISFESQLRYSQRGYNHNIKVPFRVFLIDNPYQLYETEKSHFGFENRVEQYYVTNSWLIGYSIGRRIELKFQTGFYWGLFLNSNTKSKDFYYGDPEELIIMGDPEFKEGYHETIREYENDPSLNNNYDFGLVGQITVGYSLNNTFQVVILPSYYFGLLDITNRATIQEAEHFNRSISLCIGMKIRL